MLVYKTVLVCLMTVTLFWTRFANYLLAVDVIFVCVCVCVDSLGFETRRAQTPFVRSSNKISQ